MDKCYLNSDKTIGYSVYMPAAGNPVKADRVSFNRYNASAGVRELVSIHWTEVFKWAKAPGNHCSLSVAYIEWSNGTKSLAKGLYIDGILDSVCTLNGDPKLWRVNPETGMRF